MDIYDLFFNFIIITCVCLIVVCCCGAVVCGIEEQKEVEKCFMQEPKTKECEYILYRYENRSKHTTTVMPMPIVVR